jgi:AraC-like DNA-binding protein/predicted transcriptional regulator YdeE
LFSAGGDGILETQIQIEMVVNYIDHHVKEQFDSDMLAEIGACSKSHFFKLFTLHTGYTPMNYVLRRKLQFATKRLITRTEKIIDIALEFGFESHDVFSRAFKRVYGITPESYRKRRYTLPAMRKLEFMKGEQNVVNVQIVDRPSMHLLGVEGWIGNGDGEMSISDVWERYFQSYDQLFSKIENRVRPEDDAEYAVGFFDADGKLGYFVGFEVESLDVVPSGAARKNIPPMKYAKATHVGPPGETLGQTLDYVYGEWFLNSTYRTGHLRDTPFAVIEYYDKRSSLTPPEMDIFVPIKPPTENRITEIAPFKAVCYRATGNDAAKLKYEAFDFMIKWVEKYDFAENAPYKLGVKYGETVDHETFCEVYYKYDAEDGLFSDNDKVMIKDYIGGTFAVSVGVHHFLEKDWATFVKWLEGHPNYKAVGDCYEEFLIQNGKVDFYTTLEFYEKVEKR